MADLAESIKNPLPASPLASQGGWRPVWWQEKENLV